MNTKMEIVKMFNELLDKALKNKESSVVFAHESYQGDVYTIDIDYKEDITVVPANLIILEEDNMVRFKEMYSFKLDTKGKLITPKNYYAFISYMIANERMNQNVDMSKIHLTDTYFIRKPKYIKDMLSLYSSYVEEDIKKEGVNYAINKYSYYPAHIHIKDIVKLKTYMKKENISFDMLLNNIDKILLDSEISLNMMYNAISFDIVSTALFLKSLMEIEKNNLVMPNYFQNLYKIIKAYYESEADEIKFKELSFKPENDLMYINMSKLIKEKRDIFSFNEKNDILVTFINNTSSYKGLYYNPEDILNNNSLINFNIWMDIEVDMYNLIKDNTIQDTYNLNFLGNHIYYDIRDYSKLMNLFIKNHYSYNASEVLTSIALGLLSKNDRDMLKDNNFSIASIDEFNMFMKQNKISSNKKSFIHVDKVELEWLDILYSKDLSVVL